MAIQQTDKCSNNAIKHGKPKRVDMRLATKGGRMVLTVADDGVGLPSFSSSNERQLKGLSTFPAALPCDGGIGLRTMQYRAQMIGAVFDIRRRRRQGTLVSCSIRQQATKTPDRKIAQGVKVRSDRTRRAE